MASESEEQAHLVSHESFLTPESLKAYSNVKISNGNGLSLGTNSAVLAIHSQFFHHLLNSFDYTDAEDVVTILMPDIDVMGMCALDQLFHEGKVYFSNDDGIHEIRGHLESMGVIMPVEFWENKIYGVTDEFEDMRRKCELFLEMQLNCKQERVEDDINEVEPLNLESAVEAVAAVAAATDVVAAAVEETALPEQPMDVVPQEEPMEKQMTEGDQMEEWHTMENGESSKKPAFVGHSMDEDDDGPSGMSNRNKRRYHKYPKIHQCSKCNEIFVSVCALDRKEFERHERIHEKDRLAWCNACGHEFLFSLDPHRYKDLDKRRAHHALKMGPYHNGSCTYPQCSFVFETWREHLQHINYFHYGIMQHRCGFCLKIFQNKAAMEHHIHKEHPKPMGSKMGVPGPNIMNEYICDICGTTYPEVGRLNAHVKRKHERMRDTPCQHCGKIFNNLPKLKAHIKIVHKVSQPFKCDYCGKFFKRKFRMKEHIIKMHTADEEKPYRCHICGKGMPTNINLLRHVKIHEDKREFKCSVCAQGFNDFANRNQHERRVHKLTNDSPVGCSLCGERFLNSSYRRKHEKDIHKLRT